MDRLEQLRQRMTELGRQLEDMKILVDGEKRSATVEEKTKADEIIKEMDSIDIEMENLEFRVRMDDTLKRSKREPVRPDVMKTRDTRKEFRAFGEQLQAIIAAGSPGGALHPSLRAASGLSEGVPSDGGLA